MKLYVVHCAKVARTHGNHRQCEQTIQNIGSGADQSVLYEYKYLYTINVHNMMYQYNRQKCEICGFHYLDI